MICISKYLGQGMSIGIFAIITKINGSHCYIFSYYNNVALQKNGEVWWNTIMLMEELTHAKSTTHSCISRIERGNTLWPLIVIFRDKMSFYCLILCDTVPVLTSYCFIISFGTILLQKNINNYFLYIYFFFSIWSRI